MGRWPRAKPRLTRALFVAKAKDRLRSSAGESDAIALLEQAVELEPSRCDVSLSLASIYRATISRSPSARPVASSFGGHAGLGRGGTAKAEQPPLTLDHAEMTIVVLAVHKDPAADGPGVRIR